MKFRRHLVAFVAVNAVLNAANAFYGDYWWAFWPLAIWSLALVAHYLVYKSRRVDERWVEERTDDVRSQSYDRAHMDSIEDRLKEKK
jgi:CBS-domain-containing membrane protein